jgi:SAM-dependent methyltransferase
MRRDEVSGAGEPEQHWFEPLADHMGRAYLRYSFTKGTEQEVDFLVDVLGLEPGMRVLDVGCGPGRHAHALGRRGINVFGVDISQRFVDIAAQDAPAGVEFVRQDARRLDVGSGFDAAISLCQGAFGLVGPGPDIDVLDGMAAAIRPGGRVAVSAFSSYFSVLHQHDATFDPSTGVTHEHTEVRDESGIARPAELWTTCYTPRELRLLAERAGLEVDAVWSVDPGRYERAAPTVQTAELLVVAHGPG